MADRVVDFLFGVVSGGFDLFARRFLGYGFGEYVKDIFPYFILALASAILSCGVYLLLPSDLWRLCLVGRLCRFVFGRSIHVEIGDVAGDAVDVEESCEERR